MNRLRRQRRPLPTGTVSADSQAFLVADIGGTNARFAFAYRDDPVPQSIANYAVEDFPCFDSVLDQLQHDWGMLKQSEAPFSHVCLAVAAIPEQPEISFTNNAWRFTAESVAARLGCPNISIINDFAAVARKTPEPEVNPRPPQEEQTLQRPRETQVEERSPRQALDVLYALKQHLEDGS